MGFFSGLKGIVSAALPFVGSTALGMSDTIANGYFNKRAASQQNGYQWAFWKANNDYNSPASQMQRLEEAGLNPNLVYGNGAATHQATMATAPKVAAAQSNMLASLQTANMFGQMANTEAQTDIIRHNLKYAEANNLPYGVPKTPANVIGPQVESGLNSVSNAFSSLISALVPLKFRNPYLTGSGLRVYNPTKPALGSNVNRKKSNFKLRFW
uniref:DNA pilot protein n=1 Tax=Dulem virus 90 TaxID=3145801 RepID=A0AAU8B5V3_9VIRU